MGEGCANAFDEPDDESLTRRVAPAHTRGDARVPFPDAGLCGCSGAPGDGVAPCVVDAGVGAGFTGPFLSPASSMRASGLCSIGNAWPPATQHRDKTSA